jgi:hypothetical protein
MLSSFKNDQAICRLVWGAAGYAGPPWGKGVRSPPKPLGSTSRDRLRKSGRERRIEHEARWQRGNIPSLADGAVSVKQDGEANREHLEECPYAQVNFGNIDGNDGKWLVAGGRCQPLQRSDFAYTWLAPCRKEMHQDDLACEGLQVAPITAEIIEREGGFAGAIPDFQRDWWSALRCLGRARDDKCAKASRCPSGGENRKGASGDELKAGSATGFRICRTLNWIYPRLIHCANSIRECIVRFPDERVCSAARLSYGVFNLPSNLGGCDK